MAVSEIDKRPLRTGRIAALLLSGLVAADIAAQLAVFAFAGRPFQSLSVNRWSPYGLVRNNPALTSPSFEINRDGFRTTREFDKRKPPGVFRIILLGGSALYSGVVPGAARL